MKQMNLFCRLAIACSLAALPLVARAQRTAPVKTVAGVELPDDLVASDKAVLQTRGGTVNAAGRKLAASGIRVTTPKVTKPLSKLLDGRKLPELNLEPAPTVVVLKPGDPDAPTAYLKLIAPVSVAGGVAKFAQVKSPILFPPDGFFVPDSHAEFGFEAKKAGYYMIGVTVRKISAPASELVVFPLAETLAGGTFVTQAPIIITLSDVEKQTFNLPMKIGKSGWYGFRIGLKTPGEWELFSAGFQSEP